MRHSPFLLLFVLLACRTSSAPVPETLDSVGQDSPVQDSGLQDSGLETCDEEGEACEVYAEGSSCCNGRHTCFEEGCYYIQP